ncbi:hypothetical protein BAUCODRAFT_39735 [Baudoinia panamericana UAMH 10762]|uniref:Secreted protein n=1 Tax=Baudoinia panamericana (strain UAMH 10762) TaxID=717646 RepID=M2M321_BAUPA|nr:uncharacterized protein BAUCODRAFT_39735 [Baudoinia panamericana UAMH 10762]EMC90931.1 hypothetical protein BAUCODRAFT_39735 [Baudoinia panamericana UAMH 10762]
MHSCHHYHHPLQHFLLPFAASLLSSFLTDSGVSFEVASAAASATTAARGSQTRSRKGLYRRIRS